MSAGRIDEDLLRDVLAGYRPECWRPDFAVDASVWARCDAECSPGRGFYYHPARQSAGQPIVAGSCYSWLVALSGSPDAWTAPLDARRLRVGENPNQIAAVQIRAVLGRLRPLPMMALFAFNGGYDPVQLSVELAGIPAQIVVRVRDDRAYFARPVPRVGGRGGRPRRHGVKVACADPGTWPVHAENVVRPAQGRVEPCGRSCAVRVRRPPQSSLSLRDDAASCSCDWRTSV